MTEKYIPCVLDPRRTCPEYCTLRIQAESQNDLLQEIFSPDDFSSEDFRDEFITMEAADQVLFIMNQIQGYEEQGLLEQCVEVTLTAMKE